MDDNNITDKIQKASDTISLINKEAYRDIFLLSNQVLSKSPFNNNFLNHYLNNKNIKNYPLHMLVLKVIVYYIKSSLHFMMYLVKFMEYYCSLFRFYPSGKELIIIDTSFIIDKIAQQGTFQDAFFSGLKEALERKNKHYAYLPFFYSSSYHKKPLELYRVLKILKKEKVPVITEYQLLKLPDLLRILSFIFTYPLHLLKVVNAFKINSYEKKLLKYELMDTLDQVTFYNFSRFLLGKRILKLPYRNFKVISWYENQPLHKNFYKGLRTDASRVTIYGAQLFLRSKNFLSIEPDKNEKAFGVLPDWIIANGTFYIPKDSELNYRKGPSLRSSNVFHTTIARENQKNILVLLPFFNDDAENILQILSDVKLSSQKILLKAHPAIPLYRYRHRVPSHVTVTDENIYRLFQDAKIVISASSGILLEASSLGIPVISVKNNKRFDFYNPLPEEGKGIIWEEVRNSEELIRQVDKFNCIFKEKPEKIDKVASSYKDMFFCEVTDENISRAFDL